MEAVTRERNILKQLSHPNIIKLFDTFEDVNNLYYVFEYPTRGSLAKLMSKLSIG